MISAENQQERLIKIGWILGFVDGEGCFSIHFVKQPDRQDPTRVRRGYTTGYQVGHQFAVVQGARSLDALKKIQSFFGIGRITINKRHDNHKEHLYMYTVKRREELLNVIIPFFEQYPLQTAKNEDFRIFASCVRLIENGYHRTHEGVANLALLTQRMNHKRARTDMIRILRGHTSSPL